MTVYVETEFLLAFAKDADWLGNRAEEALEAHEFVTTSYAYLVVLFRERQEFDFVKLVSNMLVFPSGTKHNARSSSRG